MPVTSPTAAPGEADVVAATTDTADNKPPLPNPRPSTLPATPYVDWISIERKEEGKREMKRENEKESSMLRTQAPASPVTRVIRDSICKSPTEWDNNQVFSSKRA
jgi:hypothetical protein